QLDVSETMAVLEVGTGSGYNAALIAEIVGSLGRVVTIELDPHVAEQARRNLKAIGYEQVRVLDGDALAGCTEEAPYDRIIVTTGVPDLSVAWIEQLSEGGIIVAPIRLNGLQLSAALTKLDSRRLVSKSLFGCGFSSIRGEWTKAEPLVGRSPEIEQAQRIWQEQRWKDFDDFRLVAERLPGEIASRHFTFSIKQR
ncbi:MAG: methyltransferase domain-containing protein, partial [Chloroflexi bacterium]